MKAKIVANNVPFKIKIEKADEEEIRTKNINKNTQKMEK